MQAVHELGVRQAVMSELTYSPLDPNINLMFKYDSKHRSFLMIKKKQCLESYFDCGHAH